MKKIASMVCILFSLLFLLTGCAPRKLPYHEDLGYRFQNVPCSQIVFKVYHTNADTHMWEFLTEFSTSPPQEGHFLDVWVNGVQSHLDIRLEDRYEEGDGTEVRADRGTYQLDLEGFDGLIPANERAPYLKNTTEEQFGQLYHISDGDSVEFGQFDLSMLSMPYDTENQNIENLLVTVTIVR